VRWIRLFFLLVAGFASLCFAQSALAAAPVFVITGGGNGHGVGMSQYGAEGFALHGYGYRHILAHYYPGTTLSHMNESPVRVLLASGASRVTIGSAARFHVTDARGRHFVLPAGDHAVTPWFSVKVGRKQRVLRMPLRFRAGAAPLTLDGTAYRGSLTVRRGLAVVNTVAMESYLRGVVPAEMPSHWLRQALETQAVAARSYALSELKPGSSFDVYPDQRDQVYLGVGAERATTDDAIARTAGEVLTWHGAVARTYFYSSSGGRTADAADAWPGVGDVPYLRSVDDPYDSISPYHRWRPLVLTAARLEARLGVNGVGDVETTSGASGWVRTVRVQTTDGSQPLPATEFANRLGLRSQWFQVGVLRLDAPVNSTVFGNRIPLHVLARGLRVTLQFRRPEGLWRSAPLSRSWVHVRPVRTTEYRLAAPGAATEPVRIDVAPALDVTSKARRLSGHVRPGQARLHVAIQRLIAGNWLTIRSARLEATGVFSLDRELPAGIYRARTAATGELLAAASRPIRLP
jgi:stage II sporulation protein D